MKIESIIQRAEGTEVVLDRTRYVFRPLDKNDKWSPHVAEVTNEDHIAILLGISEGYREYVEGQAVADAATIIAATAPQDPSPIQQAIATDIAEREAAMREQSEFMDQLAKAHAENAANIAAHSQAAVLKNGNDGINTPADDDDDDDDDDNGTDNFSMGGLERGMETAGIVAPEEADGSLSRESLESMDLPELRSVYAAFVGQEPSSRANKPTLINAILKSKTS